MKEFRSKMQQILTDYGLKSPELVWLFGSNGRKGKSAAVE